MQQQFNCLLILQLSQRACCDCKLSSVDADAKKKLILFLSLTIWQHRRSIQSNLASCCLTSGDSAEYIDVTVRLTFECKMWFNCGHYPVWHLAFMWNFVFCMNPWILNWTMFNTSQLILTFVHHSLIRPSRFFLCLVLLFTSSLRSSLSTLIISPSMTWKSLSSLLPC